MFAAGQIKGLRGRVQAELEVRALEQVRTELPKLELAEFLADYIAPNFTVQSLQTHTAPVLGDGAPFIGARFADLDVNQVLQAFRADQPLAELDPQILPGAEESDMREPVSDETERVLPEAERVSLDLPSDGLVSPVVDPSEKNDMLAASGRNLAQGDRLHASGRYKEAAIAFFEAKNVERALLSIMEMGLDVDVFDFLESAQKMDEAEFAAMAEGYLSDFLDSESSSDGDYSSNDWVILASMLFLTGRHEDYARFITTQSITAAELHEYGLPGRKELPDAFASARTAAEVEKSKVLAETARAEQVAKIDADVNPALQAEMGNLGTALTQYRTQGDLEGYAETLAHLKRDAGSRPLTDPQILDLLAFMEEQGLLQEELYDAFTAIDLEDSAAGLEDPDLMNDGGDDLENLQGSYPIPGADAETVRNLFFILRIWLNELDSRQVNNFSPADRARTLQLIVGLQEAGYPLDYGVEP